MQEIKTKSGTPDRMFGFGFDTPTEVFLTRGFEAGVQRDCSDKLFEAMVPAMRIELTARRRGRSALKRCERKLSPGVRSSEVFGVSAGCLKHAIHKADISNVE